MNNKSDIASLTFSTLINSYKKMQADLVTQIRALSNDTSSADPGKFILLQFQMAQVTQVGESISNLIYQVNAIISNAIRNQKTQ